jgi:hypothetical protein
MLLRNCISAYPQSQFFFLQKAAESNFLKNGAPQMHIPTFTIACENADLKVFTPCLDINQDFFLDSWTPYH